MRIRGLRFWLLLILIAGNHPALAQDRPEQSPPDPQAPVEGASGQTEPPPPPDDVAELEAIADYRVMREPLDSKTRENPAQILNPFEARKPRSLHGSLYEFHRNDNLDARNFFDPVGQPLPEFKRNQFGFQLGGDVGKRLSLFGSYDGLRIVRGSTQVSRVPSLAQRQGDFSELGILIRDPLTGLPFPDNRIPQERINEVSRRILEVFPLPNRNEPERNYVNNRPNVDNVDTYLFRADFQVGPDTKLLGRYIQSDERGVEAGDLPSFDEIRTDLEHEFNLALNHNFSDNVISQLGLRFFRSTDAELSPNAGQAGLLESLGIAGLSLQDELDEGYPEIRIDGYSDFGDGDSPSTSVRNRFVVQGSLNYAKGDHNLTFASAVTFQQMNNFRSGDDRRGTFEFGGDFTGDSLADFLLGFPAQAERATGRDRVDMRRALFEFSVDDDWRVSPHFNLNLGVRYFYYQPYRSLHPLGGFFPLVVEPGGAGQVVVSGTREAEALGFGSSPGRLVLPDRNDWAPRVGIAYSPFGNNRLVLRASYTTFYLTGRDWQAVNFLGRNYPFYQRETAVSSALTPELNLSNPFQNAAPPEIVIRGVEPNTRTPYVQIWQLVVQKRLFQQWKVDLSYVGSKGTKMTRIIPGNIPLPGPGSLQERRPTPEFGSFSIVSGGGSWSEHRLGLDVERQLADGFSVKAGLGWGRQISDVVFFRVSNPRDLASERAVDRDIPAVHGFVNYIFDLPFGRGRSGGWFRRAFSGWRISGITRFRSGEPYGIDLSSDVNNDGLSNDRPDRLGSGVLDSGSRSIDQWFNVNDFAQPAAFTFGNAGRNILEGPGFQAWDISLSKRTSLADGHFLEFRVEFFNAFNHVNFDNPESTLGTSSFGQVFGAADAREIEIALKYSF